MSAGAAATGSDGVWLRDLTCSGVESNPGPCSGAAGAGVCDCPITADDLRKKGVDIVDGHCPECNHDAYDHKDIGQPAAEALLTAAVASHSVGRVLTWLADSTQGKKQKTVGSADASSSSSTSSAGAGGLWVVSGQCVCVAHARIMLTATHICFNDQAELYIRVLYTPNDGDDPQAFPAKLIRYSGRMDVAVLLLDTAASPFRPATVLPASGPLLAALQPVVLACFPLAVELLAHGGKDNLKVVVAKAGALVNSPSLMAGSICNSLPRSTSHNGVHRAFQLVCASYDSFVGCAGGGVFSRHLSVTGAPQLMCVDTSAIYQTGHPSRVGSASIVPGEFDGASASVDIAAGSASRKRKDVAGEGHSDTDAAASSSSAAAAAASSAAMSADTGSTTPEDPRPKNVQLKLAKEVQQQKATLAVSVVAEAALMQHPAWKHAALVAEADASPPSGLVVATGDMVIGIARLEQEAPVQQSSPRFFLADAEHALLYD